MAKPDVAPIPHFIALYGLTLRVVRQGGIDYVDVRPLSDMATMNWPTVQGAVLTGDGLELYGTKLLVSPLVAFDERPKGSDRPSPFVQLDRLRTFLMRIDTEKMRWRGHVAQADQLLADQLRWSDVLDRAEPHEVAPLV